MDEFRVSNVERSVDWLSVQRASANDSYVIFGSEQSTANAATIKSQIMTISDNQDDGHSDKNNYSYNNTITRQGNDYSCFLVICSNFDSFGYYRMKVTSAIPAGASIFNAVLKLYGRDSENWNSSTRNLTVYLQNAASAAKVTGSDVCPGCGTNIPVVASSVNWNATSGLTWLVNSWNQTPNLSTMVGNLLTTQSGLTAGNYLQFWLTRKDGYDNSTVEVGSEDFGAEDFNQAHVLIEWTE
jgi:hypothetical protein